MYRIWCKFEPQYRRADGGIAGSGPCSRSRGAWVVVDCDPRSSTESQVLRVEGVFWGKTVGIRSFTPRRSGTRVSPIKLLRSYQLERNYRQRELHDHA